MLLLLSVTFIACKKDNDDSPKTNSAPFIGKWVGTYGFGSNHSDDYFALNIQSNGTIQEIGENSGMPVGQGTWKIEGNSLVGDYKMVWAPYNQYGVKVTINTSTGKMEGTWGSDGSATDGGKVLLSKQ